MSEKAVSLEELFKQIENLCQVEMDLAQQNKEFAIYQSADYLKREIPKLVESFVAGLRDLRNNFPKIPKKCMRDSQSDMWYYDGDELDDFFKRLTKWLKGFVALEGAK